MKLGEAPLAGNHRGFWLSGGLGGVAPAACTSLARDLQST